MRQVESNANSTSEREQAVRYETGDASIVRIEPVEGGTNLPATIDASSTSEAVAAYVRRRWSPFALDAEKSYALAWIVGAFSLVALVVAITSRGVEGYGSVAVEPTIAPRLIVDVRTAEWTDFAMLPGVGRTLAQRMVEARDAAGSELGPATFEAVRGVGPITWRRIEPYLRFSDS